MKKLIHTVLIVLTVFIALGCSDNTIDTPDYITGDIILPTVISLDSSDGNVEFPHETEADDESITWSSSDESTVSINGEGIITIHKAGEVSITATSGEYTATSKLMATYDKYTDYTRIKTKAEFLMIFSDPNNFNSPDKKYVLTSDIDFNGDHIEPIGGWDQSDEETPIDPTTAYRATLDGRGFALKNFVIDNPRSTNVDGSYYGVSLIPFMVDGAVRNLNIIDATFSGSGFTGSIVGKIEGGIIENCFVRATIVSTADNTGIPAGGIAGIIGADAVIENVILDVEVKGGFIYSGFSFGIGRNSSAISETLNDSGRRRPMLETAITTNKGNDEEDAALTQWIDVIRIESDQLTNINAYTLTQYAKQNIWTSIDGSTLPFIIRHDGQTPSWAIITEEE